MRFRNAGRFSNSNVPINKRDMLRVTASLNFPSLATLVNGELTVAVPGCEVGDSVTVHPAAGGTDGFVYTGWVSAADVVTVRAHNVTTGTVDAAALNVEVLVWRQDL